MIYAVIDTNVLVSALLSRHSDAATVQVMKAVYINGAPQGITFHETDEYTLYPASIISVNKNRFTKHYFIGDKRIASKIGSGSFNNVYGQNGSFLTAGQQDYAERLNQIETQREDYYRELGIAPGIPTMKGSYGDPENTGVGYNTIIKELGDHTVPAEWAQYVKHNTEADTAPGAPIQWDDPSDPETALPGYGFIADNSTEEETFYYHSDHLGSTSYITDGNGNITQYDAYLPYGELLVDEHSSSEDLPYKFNGKELDEETGLYYYGARYMQPVASIWYGVDPLTEKYPGMGGYVYCVGNPIRLVDPDGNGWYETDGGTTVQYSAAVNNQEQAVKFGGEGAKYLFQEGFVRAKDYSYRYNLMGNGDVTNAATGDICLGTTVTRAGTSIVNSNSYIGSYVEPEPTFFQKMSNSDNLLVKYAYSMINDIYIGFQALDPGFLERPEWKNPFTGANFGNLDGSPCYNQTDAIPGLAGCFFGLVRTPNTISHSYLFGKDFKLLNKLNAAQFSKTFKGTSIASMKSSTRGTINRGINYGIDKVNSIWNNKFNDVENMFQKSINWETFMYNNNKQKK
ncbi:MAG: RHS repeat-associated core domain-containing protein [Prevotella sp.]|nr:RHS repeat-associated core domain-containing protein [Prevotella sp.]